MIQEARRIQALEDQFWNVFGKTILDEKNSETILGKKIYISGKVEAVSFLVPVIDVLFEQLPTLTLFLKH